MNTFQSIAGLEENFHKEMSKVGPGDPCVLQALGCALVPGPGAEAYKGLVKCPLSGAGACCTLVTTAPPLGPGEEPPTPALQELSILRVSRPSRCA